MATVLFVHGTGVRQEKYLDALDVITGRVAEIDANATVRPCLWGKDLGAKLVDGKSVPDYAADDKLSDVDRARWEDQSRWAVLEYDPFYELRLLGLHAPEIDDPLQQQAGLELMDSLTVLANSDEQIQRLAGFGLDGLWVASFGDLLDSHELKRVRAATTGDGTEERQACARALVALAEHRASTAGQARLSPERRDAVVNELIFRLGADVAAGMDFVAKAATIVLGGTALTMAPGATWAAARQRGAVADRTAPLAGDVLLYQARGEQIRNFVKDAILAAGTDVTILAHSLGGIACVDLLATEDLPQVTKLITVGSQAPFLYEVGALWSLELGDPLPSHFPPWSNFYDKRDLLSFVANGVFPSEADPNVFVTVDDREVNNRCSFPRSHSAYWQTDSFWKSFRECLT